MGIIFKLDGTEETFEDKFDLQEELKDRLKNYDESIFDYFGALRIYRDIELKESDWTQGADSPLNSTTKTAWATYRTKLRDLPANAKAPMWFEESDWPLAPGQSSIPDDAVQFLKSNADPLGIGTTSWVGVGTDGVYFEQTQPYGEITGDISSKVGGISTDKVVIGTHNSIDFEFKTTNMFVGSQYNYIIETDNKTSSGFINRMGVLNIVPDSNYNGISTIPVSISGAGGTMTSPGGIIVSVIAPNGREYTTEVGVGTT